MKKYNNNMIRVIIVLSVQNGFMWKRISRNKISVNN